MFSLSLGCPSSICQGSKYPHILNRSTRKPRSVLAQPRPVLPRRGRSLRRSIGAISTKDTDSTVLVPEEVSPEELRESRVASTRSPSPKSRIKAVAAKITAARELARRLAEEKQAAIATEKDTSEKILKATEAAAAAAAVQAAMADAESRDMRKSKIEYEKEERLERLQEFCRALVKLVYEVTPDKEIAKGSIQQIIEKYEEEGVNFSDILPTIDMETAMATVPLETAPEKEALLEETEIVQVYTQLAMAAEKIKTTEDSEKEFLDLATVAVNSNATYFTVPETVKVGCAVKIFYDRSRGPLPQSSSLAIKYGLNKWQEILIQDMVLSPGMAKVSTNVWWEVELELIEDLFRFDFVIFDKYSGLVDNNESKDFRLRLVGGPTEEELLEKRLQLFEESERKREASIAADIEVYRNESKAKIKVAIEKAIVSFRERHEEDNRKDANVMASKRRASAAKAQGKTANSIEGKFKWIGEVSPGKTAKLIYNKESGPLSQNTSQIRAHINTDHWFEEENQVLKAERLSDAYLKKNGISGGDWWGIDIEIPQTASVIDFVFDNGNMDIWDNNNNNDYHTAVSNPLSQEQLVQFLFEKVTATLKDKAAAQEKALASAAERKIKSKVESHIRRMTAQSQYLFTEPLRPRAGETVEIFYRPDMTVLRGRPDVFLTASFNRGKHEIKFSYIKMKETIPGGVGFSKATIEIPKDAYMIDLIFSDTTDSHGGFYDNNKGFSYHIPVGGSIKKMEPLKIVHVTVEMAPIAKVGGLGDVVTALGRAVQEDGHKVQVFIPKYDCIDYDQVEGLTQEQGFNYSNTYVQTWKGKVEGLDVIFFEPSNGVFWVGCIYGRNDDAYRFQFFCNCTLEYFKIFNVNANIIHCHDWQTAPVAWGDLRGARAVFTIHNLNYGADLIGRAMSTSAVATTVSPTYATEISGHNSIAPNLSKLFGIINGIDVDIWNPSQDKFIPVNYSVENFIEGKSAVRYELRKRLNLCQIDVPIVGVVTRLTPQKGIHLIRHAAWRTLERGGQFVLLGSAPDPRIQTEFNTLAADLKAQYPDRARLWFAYDEPLSHLIYAGCDMFLVPSIFEPCGLTQMIAMRYGTIPIVRRTGGLNDTVFDIDNDIDRAASFGLETNGFNFDGVNEEALDFALNRALAKFFNDRTSWNKLCKRVMLQDWSWALPAMDYLELYYKALE